MDESQVVGALAPEDQVEYKFILAGIGPEKVVSVFNPLSQDFRVQYARQLAQTPNLSEGARIARDRVGLDLSKEQGVQGHAIQYHILKAGKTENLPGDIAQLAVRQLRNHLILFRNKGKSSNMLADPFTQVQTEKEIVVNIVDSGSFLNQVPIKEPEQPKEPKAEPAKAENPPPGTGVSYQSAKNK